jgi:hypothetical protein
MTLQLPLCTLSTDRNRIYFENKMAAYYRKRGPRAATLQHYSKEEIALDTPLPFFSRCQLPFRPKIRSKSLTYLVHNLLDLLHDALHAVPGGGNEDGNGKGEGYGHGDGEGGVVHLAGGGHMDGDGHRDGSGLAQTLRLGGLVAGVGPTAHTLGITYVALHSPTPLQQQQYSTRITEGEKTFLWD